MKFVVVMWQSEKTYAKFKPLFLKTQLLYLKHLKKDVLKTFTVTEN